MTIKDIVVPDLGGATEVVVIEVLVKPGDTIERDTALLTLESDKATMDVPAAEGGLIKSLTVKVGDTVSTGSVIGSLELTATSEPASAEPIQNKASENAPAKLNSEAVKPITEVAKAPSMPVNNEQAQPVADTNLSAAAATDVHAGPAVRRIAREFGINLAEITGSGPKQRILKEDVQAYVKSRLSQGSATSLNGLPAAPTVDFAKFGPVAVQPLSRIKKISGKNLHRNWLLVPHVTQFGEADITELEAFRAAQKHSLEKHGVKLTPLVFIMKAVVACLKAFPQFNASLDASSENLVLKNYFHIGVAVDTPDGLVVPVIRDVDQKGLQELAQELSVVSEKARNKQLTANDMQGGCFSISSLGGIGGTAFTPIVNVPEVAILGVSKAAHKPIYQDQTFVPRLMLPLSLSYDHRVIDGADGARFMVKLSQLLSDIRNLLL